MKSCIFSLLIFLTSCGKQNPNSRDLFVHDTAYRYEKYQEIYDEMMENKSKINEMFGFNLSKPIHASRPETIQNISGFTMKGLMRNILVWTRSATCLRCYRFKNTS